MVVSVLEETLVNRRYLVPTPHLLANTYCRSLPIWFLDFPKRKGLPARGFKQFSFLLRHFTGTCRCLLEVALPCVCFHMDSLVFTHHRDRLETDRDIRSDQTSFSFPFFSCTSCASNSSCSSLVLKRFSFSHLSRQIYPHSSARIIIHGEGQPSSCVQPGFFTEPGLSAEANSQVILCCKGLSPGVKLF